METQTRTRRERLSALIGMYWLFFQIGATTFGGGYAMLPILRREIVGKRKWCTEEQVMDFYAVSQGMPGIIAINVSVFIGRAHMGIPGAIVAALGMVSPCLIIIMIIAACLKNFQDNPYVRRALAGISVCVAALILDAVVGLWKKGVKDVVGLCICVAVLVLVEATAISPIAIILAAAGAGVLVRAIRKKRGGAQ